MYICAKYGRETGGNIFKHCFVHVKVTPEKFRVSSIRWRHYNFSQNGERVKTVFFFKKPVTFKTEIPSKRIACLVIN